MGRKPWTTPDQRKWLEALIPAFLEGQENHTARAFYSKVYDDWAQAFPPSQPSDAEVQKAGGVEQAVWAQRKAQDNVSKDLTKGTKNTHILVQRLFQWFHNATRQSNATTKSAVIPVKKTTKLPAAWQAYSSLFYQSKLKILVDNAWEAYNAQARKEDSEAATESTGDTKSKSVYLTEARKSARLDSRSRTRSCRLSTKRRHPQFERRSKSIARASSRRNRRALK